MKILLASYVFSPSIGGIESVSAALALSFHEQGHEVIIVTETPAAEDTKHWPFPVLRRPDLRTLWRAIRWADVVFHNNISVRLGWPLLFTSRPWVIAHQTWIAQPDGRKTYTDWLKRLLLYRAQLHISISQAMARSLPVPSVFIGNPCDLAHFRRLPQLRRELDVVSVGRLVSDKGADLLLRALAELAHSGLRPRCTIVGNGPEDSALRALAAQLGLEAQVQFAGAATGKALVELLNGHEIMVVPSRWQEPFGVVAVEGIACGCVVVGSSAGGLPEAIGPCGVTFPNGDVPALAACLRQLFTDAALRESLRSPAVEHLQKFALPAVTQRYLQIFHEVAGERA